MSADAEPGGEAMTERSLHSLARTVKAGTTILEEGTAGGGMIILLAGRLGVYRNSKKVGEITEPGAYVGESSVITGQDRMATIKAETSVTIVRLSARQATAFLGTEAAGKKMVKNIADRLEAVNEKLIEQQSRIDDLKGAMTEVLEAVRAATIELDKQGDTSSVAETRKALRALVNRFGTGRYTGRRIQA